MILTPLVLFCTVAVAIASNDNLIAVVQIFRHGQRTPVSFYNGDPYSDMDTYWAGLESGQLTNEGKRQHYALGQYSRTRYADWLPTAYSNEVIYVQTTDVDRTHMSAQANLFGLFPATGTQVWKTSVTWQPIPLHPPDSSILFTSPTCAAYTALSENITNAEEYVQLDTTYSSLFEYVSTYTGSNVTTWTEVASLYDPLHIEEQVGYALPSWTSAVYPEPVTTFAAKAFEKLTHTTQMKRLYVGTWLNNLVEYFEDMIADPTSNAKYQMYSAHDNNIVGILNSIGQFDSTEPVPFASSLWFELRTVNFVNVVNVWYKAGDSFTELSLSGCALDCPLTEVKTLLADILVNTTTWAEECAAV